MIRRWNRGGGTVQEARKEEGGGVKEEGGGEKEEKEMNWGKCNSYRVTHAIRGLNVVCPGSALHEGLSSVIGYAIDALD